MLKFVINDVFCTVFDENIEFIDTKDIHKCLHSLKNSMVNLVDKELNDIHVKVFWSFIIPQSINLSNWEYNTGFEVVEVLKQEYNNLIKILEFSYDISVDTTLILVNFPFEFIQDKRKRFYKYLSRINDMQFSKVLINNPVNFDDYTTHINNCDLYINDLSDKVLRIVKDGGKFEDIFCLYINDNFWLTPNSVDNIVYLEDNIFRVLKVEDKSEVSVEDLNNSTILLILTHVYKGESVARFVKFLRDLGAYKIFIYVHECGNQFIKGLHNNLVIKKTYVNGVLSAFENTIITCPDNILKQLNFIQINSELR